MVVEETSCGEVKVGSGPVTRAATGDVCFVSLRGRNVTATRSDTREERDHVPSVMMWGAVLNTRGSQDPVRSTPSPRQLFKSTLLSPCDQPHGTFMPGLLSLRHFHVGSNTRQAGSWSRPDPMRWPRLDTRQVRLHHTLPPISQTQHTSRLTTLASAVIEGGFTVLVLKADIARGGRQS